MRKSITATASVSLTIAITLLLAGCAVGPKYKRPAIAAPPEFRGETTTKVDAASFADLKWSEIFKDEQLQQLLTAALKNNYDLREVAAHVEEARAALGITRADQLPTVAASAGITTQRTSANGAFTAVPNQDLTRTYGSVGLNLLSYEVDLWGRLRNATAAARADLLSTEENRKAVITAVVSEVTTAYYDLLELDSEYQIAKSTLASRENSLRLIKTREQSGMASTLEVRQGEQLVQVAAQTLPIIEQQIAQTENRLRLLVGELPGPIVRTQLLAQTQPPAVPAGP